MKALVIAYFILSAAAIGYLAWEVDKLRHQDIIRTKGIIVTDSLGRDRILIGAPFPYSADRVRTDSFLVRQYWAVRMGGSEYMDWYRDYVHSGVGMVVLNEEGFDKVMIGEQLPDPNTGQRNGVPTGVLWNDDQGYERGGLGLNRLKETDSTVANGTPQYRNLIGFDDETGEALHMGVLEDGTKMIRMAWTDSVLLIGKGAPQNFLFNTPNRFVGFQLKSVADPIGYRMDLIEMKKKEQAVPEIKPANQRRTRRVR